MTCEACRAACSHGTANERAAQVHKADADVCGCERFSVSDFSPGRVKDDETLHMLISDPQHLLDGKLNPSSLIQIDKGGLSTLREAANNDEFLATCASLQQRAAAKGNPWFLHSVCNIAVGTLRYSNGDRFVCVYDTGVPDKPNHADIMGPDIRAMSTKPMSNGELERACRARIKLLIERIGPRLVSPKDFRDGAFSSFVRT